MVLKNMRPYQLKEAVALGHPLMLPAGCIETHGPHMAIGHDTIIVEEICARVAERTPIVIAPSFDYGMTGFALGGPADGTIEPDHRGLELFSKSILDNFLEMGFRKIYVNIMHQGMEGHLALTLKKAAVELFNDGVLKAGYPPGWWGDKAFREEVTSKLFGRIEVLPMILPDASPPARADHAAYNETSFLLATRPELVEQDRLDDDAPWYCRKNEELNSWTANAEHGKIMVDAVVDAWVKKIDSER